jgi:UDP-2,4-diacetamido-2,4,6-trideoxy-beta-L-altropyranose hydrolase
MRCLTLADQLRERGCQVQIICRAQPGHMGDMITKHGFQLSLLPESEHPINTNPDKEDYAAWLGVTQEEDAKQTRDALGSERPDWLIVDHYGLDIQWENELRPYAAKIMVIDDLANRTHNCDLLLDQNYFREPVLRYRGLLPEYCQTLLGPKYALLRREFCQARQFARMRGNGIARVLVYFGGSDPDNLTGMALEALDCPELRHLLVDAVIGPNNPYIQQLEEKALNRPGTRLHIQPEGFVELMLRADICIGAGGTTTWERLCLNLPSLVITVAANQEEFTKDLDRDGYVKWVGRSQIMENGLISSALLHLISNLHGDEHHDLPNIVDGQGAYKVADTLMSISTLK